jgi:hypothetical protein
MRLEHNAGCAVVAATSLLAMVSAGAAADVPTAIPAKAPVVTPAPSPWSFQFTPYVWAAGLHGNARLGPNAPATNLDVDFSDLLQHLGFAAMGTVEVRNGRFGLVADLMYLSLGVGAIGPLGYVNGQLKDKTFVGTLTLAYRLVEQGPYWLDVEAGVRGWAMNTDLAFEAVPLGASRTYSIDKSWLDPVVGVRARAELGSKFFLEGYADVGGFGVSSKSTWQVAGLLGYQYSPTTSLMAGYRYLAVNYDRGGFVWDVSMAGPIVAISFTLN